MLLLWPAAKSKGVSSHGAVIRFKRGMQGEKRGDAAVRPATGVSVFSN